MIHFTGNGIIDKFTNAMCTVRVLFFLAKNAIVMKIKQVGDNTVILQ